MISATNWLGIKCQTLNATVIYMELEMTILKRIKEKN